MIDGESAADGWKGGGVGGESVRRKGKRDQ